MYHLIPMFKVYKYLCYLIWESDKKQLWHDVLIWSIYVVKVCWQMICSVVSILVIYIKITLPLLFLACVPSPETSSSGRKYRDEKDT